MGKKSSILTLAIITIAMFCITVNFIYSHYEEPSDGDVFAFCFIGLQDLAYYILLCLRIIKTDEEWYENRW